MSEWREYQLADFADINPTERLPKGTVAKKIAMEAIQPFTKKIPSYSNEEYKGGVKFRNGDTIMARITPSLENGKTSYVDILDDDEIGFGSTEFIVFREKSDTSDKHFIYYLATSPIIRNTAILSMTGSSGRQRVQTDVVKEHLFDAPELPEQKAIAEVLSSLDDKIDLLHRQNKTLEQMAETLFRQWFVEEAQEDWEEYRVSDIANHIKENVKPASNPLLMYKHYSLPAFDNSKNPVAEIGKEILSNKYAVPPKTILVSKLNPRVPRIWAIPSIVSENSICSTEFQVFKPKKKSYYGFLCFLFKSDEAVGELEMAASGTSGSHQRVKPQDILNIPFVTPSLDKAEDYSQEVMPLVEKQQRNIDYIHTLEKLRDTLLPKLMSGEVRIASHG